MPKAGALAKVSGDFESSPVNLRFHQQTCGKHTELTTKSWIYVDLVFFKEKQIIKGPDNPRRQLLPIMSTTCCSGDGEGRKDKGGGGGSRSKTKLCVTKLCVKDGV